MKYRAWMAVLSAALTMSACTGEISNYQGEAADAGNEDLSPAADAAEPQATTMVAVVGETLGRGHKLRAEPNGTAEILHFMPDYEVLELQGPHDGTWWPVSYRGTAGWAHRKHLSAHLEDDVPTSPSGFGFLLPWRDGSSWPVTQAHGGFSHDGISQWAWDFGMPTGTPIVASHSGVVRKKRGNSTRGGCNSAFIYDANYVTIDRGDGLESHYVHLSKVNVAVGEKVERGQRIGLSGETGYSCGAHLHFQIQKSPDGGGTSAGANQSVHSYFWDTEKRKDPEAGTQAKSRNDTADIP